MSDSPQPYGLQPTRLLCPWDSLGKNTGEGVPCPPPGDLPDPGIKPRSPVAPALQADSLPSECWAMEKSYLPSRGCVHIYRYNDDLGRSMKIIWEWSRTTWESSFPKGRAVTSSEWQQVSYL